MADEITGFIGNTIGGYIPSKQSVLNFGWVIGLIILGAIALAFISWWLFTYFKYNKKIVILKKFGNKISIADYDKGMFARVGMAGDYWLKVKKYKKTLPRPKKQMAKNEYWFFEREDGEWINIDGFQDFDLQMRQLGAYFVDEDMRLQRLGIQKNLADRFQKVTFWQKYGGMIMSLIFILVITICLVMLFSKMTKAWTTAESMAQAVRDMAVEVKNMMTKTTSGAIPIQAVLSIIGGVL